MHNNILVDFSLRETHTHVYILYEYWRELKFAAFFRRLLQFDDCSCAVRIDELGTPATICAQATINTTIDVHLFEFNGHFPFEQ